MSVRSRTGVLGRGTPRVPLPSDPNVIIVSRLEDFPAPVGGVINLLANTCYAIEGFVDLLGNTLRLADQTVVRGRCSDVHDGLIRTSGVTPLMDNVAGASFAVLRLTLSHLAGGSPYYFADVGMPGATTQFSFTDSTLAGNSAPGVMDGVASGILVQNGVQAGSGVALETRGACGTVIFADVLGNNNPAALTLIRAAPGATADIFAFERVGDVRSNAGSVSLDLDALPVTTQVFVAGCVLIGPGASATVTTEANRAQPSWDYAANYGLAPSLVTAENKFSLTVAGPLSPAAVPAGTWQNIPVGYVCTLSTTTQRFIQSAGSPDEVEYTGAVPADVRFIMQAVLESSLGVLSMGLGVMLNGADVPGTETTAEVAPNAWQLTTIHQLRLAPNDLVRMRIRNNLNVTQWRMYSANLTALGLG